MGYYVEKKETGNEYVQKLIELNGYTINKCLKLPDRWLDILGRPIIDATRFARDYGLKANKVYVDPRVQKAEEFVKALNNRLEYLEKSVQELATFDARLDDLLKYMNARDYEKEYTKHFIVEMARQAKNVDPSIEKLNIELTIGEREIEYKTMYGTKTEKLKITTQNIDHWLKLRNDAEARVKIRMTNDRKLRKVAMQKLEG